MDHAPFLDSIASCDCDCKQMKAGAGSRCESLEITATPIPSGLVKVKTGANTDDTVYNNWYQSVYQIPTTEPTEQGQG